MVQASIVNFLIKFLKFKFCYLTFLEPFLILTESFLFRQELVCGNPNQPHSDIPYYQSESCQEYYPLDAYHANRNSIPNCESPALLTRLLKSLYQLSACNRDSNGHDCLDSIGVNQGQKCLIIACSDAIVQEQAMVVKLFDTPVAFTTVLRGVVHPLVAY